ncbi:protein RKD1-like [Triticum dicoccoides]|uniref:protein RKD1-like n=1 Tax=Triticum dicoccoides TaxID=85692 RepID=UPI001891E806|nr:protein RKD1-like [Triticum dicoccoides]
MEKATQTEGHLGNGAVEKPSLTFELVSQFFCMPIDEAARELNVGLTSLKRRCRELGIPRWPWRTVRSLQELIDVVKELGKDDTPEKAEKTKMVVQKLLEVMKLIAERPDVELDKETKVFRQACYKEMHERRIKRKLGKVLDA